MDNDIGNAMRMLCYAMLWHFARGRMIGLRIGEVRGGGGCLRRAGNMRRHVDLWILKTAQQSLLLALTSRMLLCHAQNRSSAIVGIGGRDSDCPLGRAVRTGQGAEELRRASRIYPYFDCYLTL